ncbi:hypothetical protein ACFL9T_11835 [Thermodesulfobacteriota bacterium]
MVNRVRINLIFGLALYLVLCFAGSPVSAFENGFDNATLRDLDSIQVILGIRVSPGIAQDILTEQIKVVLESKLQTADITVLPQPLTSDMTQVSSLLLKVEMFPHQGALICSISIQVLQDVFLAHTAYGSTYPAITWASEGVFGVIYDLSEIRNLVKSEMDQFIDAYLASKAE